MRKNMFIFCAITLSCLTQEEFNPHKYLREIKSTDISLFEGVRIEARTEKNGEYIPHGFLKEKKGKYYKIPNFEYYSYDSLPENLKDSLLSFAQDITGTENDRISYLKNYSNTIIAEFKKTNVVEIMGEPKIGNCIIFFPNKYHFIAYVPNKERINYDFWRDKFKWVSAWVHVAKLAEIRGI